MLDVIYKKLLLVVTLLPVLLSNAFAATPVATVTLPMEPNQPEQVMPLLVKGLSEVMVRLTGNAQVTDQKEVAELLKDPNVFLENYNQHNNPPRLAMAFDQSAIAEALNKAGIATWKKTPTIMVWWLSAADNKFSLMSDSQPNHTIIQQAAATQGFAIRLPIADLDEQALTDKAVFMADNTEPLFDLSKRYNTNSILAISANQLAADKWQLQWRLWQANSPKIIAKGQTKEGSLIAVTDSVFSAINSDLANIYVIKAGATKSLEVTIENIDFNSYVLVNKLMLSFNAQQTETSGSVVRYKVQADPVQLTAQLALIHLFPEKSNEPDKLIFKAQ